MSPFKLKSELARELNLSWKALKSKLKPYKTELDKLGLKDCHQILTPAIVEEIQRIVHLPEFGKVEKSG